jgi:outer membrane protein assembly factor BamB
MFRQKLFLTAIVLAALCSFLPAYAGLETQLIVDTAYPYTDRVNCNQTQWYGFNAIGGNGYCVLITPISGSGNLYLADHNFNLAGSSSNPGLTPEKVWYGQDISGTFHLAYAGSGNPYSDYKVWVLKAPYIKAIDTASGNPGTIITLTGYGFGSSQCASYVKFADTKAASYSSWSNTQVRVAVPSGVSGTVPITVWVNNGDIRLAPNRSSNPVSFTTAGNSSNGTMPRYDIARSGYAPDAPKTFPLSIKWTFCTRLSVSSPPVVANNTAYFVAEALYAVDANTGALRWKNDSVSLGPAPTVAGDKLYTNARDARFIAYFTALDANTGAVKWRFDIGGNSTITEPAVYNDVVYFTTGTKLYALNTQDGSLKWSYTAQASLEIAPCVISNNIIYIADIRGKMYALDVNNGTVKWTYTIVRNTAGNCQISRFSVYNEVVYFGNWGAGNPVALYALDANTGVLRWKVTGFVDIADLVIGKGVGYAYVNSSGFRPWAFDANTGAGKWSINGQMPAITDGLLFTTAWENPYNCLKVVDSNTGALKWKYNFTGVSQVFEPSVYGGKVYVGTVNGSGGTLYCLGQ